MEVFVVFSAIYSFADKLVINLLFVCLIKITRNFGLSASLRNLPGPSLIIPEQYIVKQSLSFLLASSMKSLLNQRAFCGIYLIVFLEQAVSQIFRTLGKGTVAGKIL